MDMKIIQESIDPTVTSQMINPAKQMTNPAKQTMSPAKQTVKPTQNKENPTDPYVMGSQQTQEKGEQIGTLRVNAEKEDILSAADEKYNQVMAEKAVENANNRMQNAGTRALFSYNKDIDRIVITIKDNAKNDIIKEIPTKDTQKMLEKIHTMTGMLMDEGI
ncbi:MAG: flagellar protein FlaG [Lachnospiraceae bacterium]